MKQLIICIFVNILFLNSLLGQNDTILSSIFVQDSLCISEATHVFYIDRTIESAISGEQIPTFSVLKNNDEPLKEFSLEIKEFSYNYLDTTVTIVGSIYGVEEEPLLPEKNVNLFIGSSFQPQEGKIYGNRTMVSWLVINGEPTCTYIYYKLNNWKHGFAQLKKGHHPTLQVFNCKFKVTPGDRYLIFALYEYKLNVFDLTEVLPCSLSSP